MEVGVLEAIVAVVAGASVLLFIALLLAAVASLVTAMAVGMLGGMTSILGETTARTHGSSTPRLQPRLGHS